MKYTKEQVEQIERENQAWQKKVEQHRAVIKIAYNKLLFAKICRDIEIRKGGQIHPRINREFHSKLNEFQNLMYKTIYPDK